MSSEKLLIGFCLVGSDMGKLIIKLIEEKKIKMISYKITYRYVFYEIKKNRMKIIVNSTGSTESVFITEIKTYKVLCDDANEYDIDVSYVKKGTKYCLKYSNSEIWSIEARGLTLLTIIDTGLGFKISPKINKCDYHYFWYLSMLSNFIIKSSPNDNVSVVVEIDSKKIII